MTQAQRSYTIEDEFGRPVEGASIYVYDATGALASLTSNGTLALANPLTTDAFGAYSYFALVGYYREDVWYGGKKRWSENNVAVGSPGADLLLRSDLAASGGSALVDYLPSGSNAIARTVQTKLRETVSVTDFGADATGTNDSYAAFAAAINALPALGGRIVVPTGTWKLLTQPTWGTKSIYWDFAPDASFTGAGTGEGKFPYLNVNVTSLPVGPYIYSQTHLKSTNANGGVNAFSVEMIQPSDYGAGQSVGIFVGARGSCANVAANVWAMNLLVRADATATGNYYGDEIDVDCYSGGASMVGLLLSGTGDHNPLAAIITDRLAGQWQSGINVRKALDGIVIFSEAGGRGVVVDAPGSTLVAAVSCPISARQFVNNGDTVFVQRFTDTSPTGYFTRGRNAANNADLYSIDVKGNAAFAGSVSQFPPASNTPTVNGQMVIELTNDTTLKIKVKGSDGTVRSTTLTLS